MHSGQQFFGSVPNFFRAVAKLPVNWHYELNYGQGRAECFTRARDRLPLEPPLFVCNMCFTKLTLRVRLICVEEVITESEICLNDLDLEIRSHWRIAETIQEISRPILIEYWQWKCLLIGRLKPSLNVDLSHRNASGVRLNGARYAIVAIHY